MTAEFTAQDWEGFKELVSKSNIQDKELILNVLSMYSDPEQREREIKNMSSVFKVLAEEILPQLRYSRITASVNVIGKSDEEISKLAKEDAKALSVDELLYAATLVKTNKEKAAIYAKVVEIYPNDYRGYNNLGMVQYEEGDLAAAQNNFAKAARIAPNTPEVAMNQGLISLANNDYAKAEQAFGKSAGVEELNEALGVFYMKKGDYNAGFAVFQIRSFRGLSRPLFLPFCGALAYRRGKPLDNAIIVVGLMGGRGRGCSPLYRSRSSGGVPCIPGRK